MAKRNKVRKKNSHQETPGAVALHFDGGAQRIYVVLDARAAIVAVIEEDRRGWGTLSDAGYSCPVYGPMQVEPMVVERLRNVPKREREGVGQIVAGLLGSPLEEEWEEWDRIKDELLRDSELVTYMDYPAMKRYLTDKKNAELIGCFENADDAIEHYHGNPRYNNPITSTSVEVSDGARLKLKNRLLR